MTENVLVNPPGGEAHQAAHEEVEVARAVYQAAEALVGAAVKARNARPDAALPNIDFRQTEGGFSTLSHNQVNEAGDNTRWECVSDPSGITQLIRVHQSGNKKVEDMVAAHGDQLAARQHKVSYDNVPSKDESGELSLDEAQAVIGDVNTNLSGALNKVTPAQSPPASV